MIYLIMNKQYLPKFNHAVNLLGGQSFSWDLIDPKRSHYLGFLQDRAIEVKFMGDYMYWQTYPQADDYDFIKKYFRLDEDYEKILKLISQDKFVKKAVEELPGIRLLKQPVDLVVLNFIISSVNSIPSIRKSIRALSKDLGDEIEIRGEKYYLFPRTEVLAEAEIASILKSKVGFRAKYLKKSANQLLGKSCANRDELKELCGVGDKIADCVSIFALGENNSTPVDRWVKRFLVDLYDLSEDLTYNEFSDWVSENFNGYASWATQFLFEWYRAK